MIGYLDWWQPLIFVLLYVLVVILKIGEWYYYSRNFGNDMEQNQMAASVRKLSSQVIFEPGSYRMLHDAVKEKTSNVSLKDQSSKIQKMDQAILKTPQEEYKSFTSIDSSVIKSH